jgi:hypothetical protein
MQSKYGIAVLAHRHVLSAELACATSVRHERAERRRRARSERSPSATPRPGFACDRRRRDVRIYAHRRSCDIGPFTRRRDQERFALVSHGLALPNTLRVRRD